MPCAIYLRGAVGKTIFRRQLLGVRTEKKHNIYAIIVTYNGSIKNIKKLADDLRRQGAHHVVVDNGSSDITFDNDINVLRQDTNLGIAKAQNIGVEYCIAHGADIIVFFDQDSVINEHFINNLIEPIIKQKTKISAPTYVDIEGLFHYPIMKVSNKGFVKKHYFDYKNEIQNFTTNTVISSGMAVNAILFQEVGLFNEELFIDYVDTEWCLRCHSYGYTCFVNTNLKMLHSIGDYSIKFGSFRVPVHSANRRYYRVRNSFLLLRMKHIPKLLCIREVSHFLIHQAVILFYQKKHIKKYTYFAFLGIFHGINNKGGVLAIKNPEKI